MPLSREDILGVEEPADLYPAHLAEMKDRTADALGRNDFDALVVHTGLELPQIGRDSHLLALPHPEMTRWAGGLHRKDVPPASGSVARLDYTLGHAVVYEPKRDKPKLYVQSDPANRWSLQAGVPEGADQYFDVVIATTQEEMWSKLRGALPKRSAFLGPENMPDVAQRRERYRPHLVHAPEALLDHLNWNKLSKTVYELACIVLANRKAALGHKAARKAFESGDSGSRLVSEGSIVHTFLGAAGIMELDSPYQPIAGFGPNSSILHYYRPNYGITSGSTLLLDAGAQHNGYASDVTCTHIRHGVNEEFVGILKGLDRVQRELVDMVRPGADFGEIQKQMYLKVAQLLIDAGVIVGCDAQKAAELGLSAAFILHSFGHSLGAHVHDDGLFQVDASGRSPAMPTDPTLIAAGYAPRARYGDYFATTVEPGVYFDPTLKDRLAARDERVGGEKAGDHVNFRLVEKLVSDGGMRLESDVVTLPVDGNVDVTREYLPDLTNAV